MRLYDYLGPGNGYKVRLLLALLGQEYDWTPLDIDRGETRAPELLAVNPNGRIPTLVLDDGTALAESNAILWYLADGTRFVPDTRLGRAQVLQWMFFEQYSHEPYVATPRYIRRHLPADHPRQRDVPQRLEQGRAALGVMETHLAGRTYFIGERYSIADIALYAYTHVDGDAGLELAAFPSVRRWLERIADEPGHVPITRVPGAS